MLQATHVLLLSEKVCVDVDLSSSADAGCYKKLIRIQPTYIKHLHIRKLFISGGFLFCLI